jgi:hypothetical protein
VSAAAEVVVMDDTLRIVSVYDGRERLGCVEIAADGEARAFDSFGQELGNFRNVEAAIAAIEASAQAQAVP